MINDVTLLRVRDELEDALACLTEEFETGRGGASSGLRAEAIAHVRKALLLLQGSPPAAIAGT